MKPEIPRVIRAMMFLYVAPLVLLFFGVGAFFEWLLEGMRR